MGALALQGPLVARHSRGRVARRPRRAQVLPRDRDHACATSRSRSRAPATPATSGYEIWVDAARAVALWDALDRGRRRRSASRPRACGRWTSRASRPGSSCSTSTTYSAHHALIEARKSSPYEINLGWAVSPAKGPFNGRRALAAERERGAAWGFVGLEIDWDSFERLLRGPRAAAADRRTWRGAPARRCTASGQQVGYATSGCWSPLLKKSLALAHLQAPHFAAGNAVGDGSDGRAPPRARRRDGRASCRSSTRSGRRHEHGALRRDHRRRRAQRPRRRRVPGARRAQDAGAGAPPADRRRGRHRGDLPRLQVLGVLLRREPAAPRDHPRPRPAAARPADPAAREHGDAARQRRLPGVVGRSRRDAPRAVPPLAARRRRRGRVRPPHAPHGDGGEADPRHGAARSGVAGAVGSRRSARSSADTSARSAPSASTRCTSS